MDNSELKTSNSHQASASAELTLKFSDGTVRTYLVDGLLEGDIETGAMRITQDNNGSQFVFIPNPNFFTGKRKRRLIHLYNLKRG